MGRSPQVSLHPRSGKTTVKTTAFTLVELLVVIGIIALLISILLPALSKARESANRTKCLSNIRQISMGFYSYAQANRGSFPFVGASSFFEDWIWWNDTGNVKDAFSGAAIPGYTGTPI